MWVGSKICAVEKTLVGKEVLGMTAVKDADSPLNNLIPIPPMLDHQADTVTIGWMEEQGAKLLTNLCKKILARKRGAWFEIFLTVFVMLNNLEYIYGQSKMYRAEFLKGIAGSTRLHCITIS